jgi:S1-C subfamily serine protease
VNDQIESSTGVNSGVGFAIPINTVKRVAPALIENGEYQHSYLGIEGGTFSPQWAEALGLPVTTKGIYVMNAVRGGPAAAAGLRAGDEDTDILLGADMSGLVYLQSGGDLITAVDGQQVTKMDDLLAYLEENTSPGQTIELSLIRAGGESATLEVELAERPAQANR